MKLNKIVKHGSSARTKLAEGAKILSDSVKITLGPFGQNWFLDKEGGKITNDGAKIAAEIVLKDEIQNRGVVALRNATRKTNDEAGDGTTTATTLAYAIYERLAGKLGDESKGVIGVPAIEMIRKVEEERVLVEKMLLDMKEDITTEEQLIRSAVVAVEDEKLGAMIGKAQFKIGPDGIILAEETADRECEIEYIKGIRFDNGLGTGEVMNNHEKQQLEVEDVRVILTNHTLKDLSPLKRVLDQLQMQGCISLLIVARAFTSEAIATCMVNIKNARMKTWPLNAPYVDQAEIMKDLAAVVGGTFFHFEDKALETMQLTDIGFASRVIAQRYNAIIAGPADEATQERVDARVKELEAKLKGSKSEFEKKSLISRISQLKGGFALLKVGAESELERKRLYDKAEDGVHAVRAAFQEGVVLGAGQAFLEISDKLPVDSYLKIPLRSIFDQITSLAPKDWKPEAWVKDPLKVLRIALKHACSAAATFATAGGVITAENPKQKMVEVEEAQEESDE